MNQEKFNKFRKEYPTFIFDSYEVIDNGDSYKIVYPSADSTLKALSKFSAFTSI